METERYPANRPGALNKVPVAPHCLRSDLQSQQAPDVRTVPTMGGGFPSSLWVRTHRKAPPIDLLLPRPAQKGIPYSPGLDQRLQFLIYSYT